MLGNLLPFGSQTSAICVQRRHAPNLALAASMSIQSYRDLEAWKIGMDLAVCVYKLTKAFPREELYGLSSQLRRAVVSIPSNISEGHQQGTKSYAYFVTLALGSLAEMETQLELASRLRYVSATETESVSQQAGHLRPRPSWIAAIAALTLLIPDP